MVLMKKTAILIIEDEKDIIELLQYNLEREGYSVLQTATAEDALHLLKKELPDLIILDLMLPGLDGLETCRLIKQETRTQYIPIIMLTAKSEESDVVVGLQLGADDYVTKPFSPKVLIARIKTVLRRHQERRALIHPGEVRKIGQLSIDLSRHKVVYQNKSVSFTTMEFNILEFLSRHPGRVFSRDQIMDQVWKEGRFIVDRAVDVHIRGLRKKLKGASDLIETVWGVGYRLKDPDESDG